jgi:hypothetical protein
MDWLRCIDYLIRGTVRIIKTIYESRAVEKTAEKAESATKQAIAIVVSTTETAVKQRALFWNLVKSVSAERIANVFNSIWGTRERIRNEYKRD